MLQLVEFNPTNKLNLTKKDFKWTGLSPVAFTWICNIVLYMDFHQWASHGLAKKEFTWASNGEHLLIPELKVDYSLLQMKEPPQV